jgi:hypothetical protein
MSQTAHLILQNGRFILQDGGDVMVSDRRYNQRKFLSCNTILVIGTLLVPLLGMAGCENTQRASRFDLSGKVTYGGKTVPKGYLRFAPDKEKGNRGPGSSASIIDGQYKTMPGQGTVGGPHVVSIVGTDGIPIDMGEGIPPNLAGKLLFPEYEVHIDLPKATDIHNFDVPASHGQDDSTDKKEDGPS